MKDKIQKLIAEIIGDGFTVDIKPVAVKPVSGSVYSVASVYGAGVIDESSVLKPLSVGNVSSDLGAGVTTYLSVYTDGEGDQAIYVNGKLESHDTTIYGPDVVRVADGRLVRMRSDFLDESLDDWPENESKLKELIDGHQAGINAGAAIGAPDRDGLVLRSEWNAKEGCFEDSRVEPKKESDWQPTPNEWVRLPNGTVLQYKSCEIHGTKKYYRFEGINSRFELGTLKPWTPKCGDWVKIRKSPASERIVRWFWRSELDCLDGETHQITRISEGVDAGYQVREIDGSGLWLALSWLTPAEPPTDYIADANKKVPGDLLVDTTVKFKDGSEAVPRLSGWTLDVDPDAYIGMLTTQVASTMPNGWMVLHTDAKTEPRAIGDRFFRVTKGHWEELTEANIEQANAQSWAAIRKIPSVVLESQELLGSKVEYREPTNDDIGKKVEVRDHEKHSWIELQLVAILPPGGPQFCVEDKSANRAIWKYARIKAC